MSLHHFKTGTDTQAEDRHRKRFDELVVLAAESDDRDSPVVCALFLDSETVPYVAEVNILSEKARAILSNMKSKQEQQKYIQDNKNYIMVHAEENLIEKFDFMQFSAQNELGLLHAGDERAYTTLYITLAPCCGCAEKVINSLRAVVDEVVTIAPKEGTRWSASQERALSKLADVFVLTVLPIEWGIQFAKDAKKQFN